MSRANHQGLTLLETVVALAILAVCAFGLIQTLRQGAIRGENFSSEHFTAMFVCQKVLEDINARTQENPHFFNQLVASATGEPQNVVDGESPFFKLLENTVNFDFLDPGEDRPIDSSNEVSFRQLKDFRCQVECRLDVPPDPATAQPFRDLIEVVVSVTWSDAAGIQQRYSVSQYLHGVGRSSFEVVNEAGMEPFSEDRIGKALWHWLASDTAPDPPTFASFLAWNGGGDPRVVKAVGDIVHFSDAACWLASRSEVLSDEYSGKRDSLAGSANPDDRKKAALYQEQVGEVFEQEGSQLFSLATQFQGSVRFLLTQTLNQANLGPRIFSARNRFRGCCWEASVGIENIGVAFSGSEAQYSKVLEDPYRGDFPERKITPLVRRILDLQKIGVLILERDGDPAPALAQLQNRIGQFQASFRGLQPFFMDYLALESGFCRSLASLRSFYGGDGGLTGLIQRIAGLKEDLFEVEKRIP